MEFKRRHITSKSTGSRFQYLSWFLGLVVCLLLFAQVIVSNRLATTGYQMNEIETDIEATSENNELLKEQIASASALTTIQIKAEKLGFNRPVRPTFLDHTLPVALGTQ